MATGIFPQQILTGFIIKSIVSFDDALTRIPVLAELSLQHQSRIF